MSRRLGRMGRMDTFPFLFSHARARAHIEKVVGERVHASHVSQRASGCGLSLALAAFVARYGRLGQVDLDALPPDALHDIYAAAIDRFWNRGAFEAALVLEQRDREDLLGAERG